MKLVIVIENDNLDELFAVGCNDLKNHFLPKALHIKPDDVKRITFEEIRSKDGKEIITMRDVYFNGHSEYQVISHPENFTSKDEKTGEKHGN